MTFNAAAHSENRFQKLYDVWQKDDATKRRGRPRNVFAVTKHCGKAIDFPAYLFDTPPTSIDDRRGKSIVSYYEPLAEDIRDQLYIFLQGQTP